MSETAEKILEVVLSITFFSLVFFAYSFAERLLRPRLLSSPSPSFSSTLSSTVGGMVVAFCFYVLLPNAALVGGLTALFILDDVHFAVRDLLIGVVAASLAIIILVIYGIVGVRGETVRDAEEAHRRRRMRQQARQLGREEE